MKVLFVCSANKDRSKTAEDIFSEKYPNHEFDSAGTNIKICRQLGTNELNSDVIEWADIIFVMESKHKAVVKKLDTNKTRTEILNIRDIYKYDDKNLKEILFLKIKNNIHLSQ